MGFPRLHPLALPGYSSVKIFFQKCLRDNSRNIETISQAREDSNIRTTNVRVRIDFHM